MSETEVGLSELPDGWEWTTVGSIGLITNGKTPKGINDLDSEGKIPFYKVNDMNTYLPHYRTPKSLISQLAVFCIIIASIPLSLSE